MKKIINFFAFREKLAFFLIFLIFVLGFRAYDVIPKEHFPAVKVPIIYISVLQRSLSPESVESLIVKPVESEALSIAGVKHVTSYASKGHASIVVEFNAGLDIDRAMYDVKNVVDRVKSEFPEEAEEPLVNEVDMSKFPVLNVVLKFSKLDERKVVAVAKELERQIERIGEVREVNIAGIRDEVVEVLVKPEMFAENAISVGSVFRVAEMNKFLNIGRIKNRDALFQANSSSVFYTVDDVKKTPIKALGNEYLRLSDVADIKLTYKDPDSIVYVDGVRSIVLEISKKSGENTITMIKKTREMVEKYRPSFPSGLIVEYSRDTSEDILDSISNLNNNLMLAIMVVVLTIFMAIGIREGLYILPVIPASFLLTIIVLEVCGFSLNTVTLFSLVLGTGLIVDMAIVVIEYAEMVECVGVPKRESMLVASKKMFVPMFVSTITTLVATMPLMFWPGLIGKFMKFLPITLFILLVNSLICTLVFLPVIGKTFADFPESFLRKLQSRKGGGGSEVIDSSGSGSSGDFSGGDFSGGDFSGGDSSGDFSGGGSSGGDVGNGSLKSDSGRSGDTSSGTVLSLETGSNDVVRLGRGVFSGVNSGGHSVFNLNTIKSMSQESLSSMSGLYGWYSRYLIKALAQPGKTCLKLFGIISSMLIVFIVLARGVEFFPYVEQDNMQLIVRSLGNVSLESKEKLVLQVEERIRDADSELKEIKTIYSTVKDTVFRDSSGGKYPPDTIALIDIELSNWENRRKAKAVIFDILREVKKVSGLIVDYQLPRKGPPSSSDVVLNIKSPDKKARKDFANLVKRRIIDSEQYDNYSDSLPVSRIQYNFEVDKSQLAMYKVPLSYLQVFLMAATDGFVMTSFTPTGSQDEVDVLLRFSEKYRTIDYIKSLKIPVETSAGAGGGSMSNGGVRHVPIMNFVKINYEQEIQEIQRLDGDNVTTITADVKDKKFTRERVEGLSEWLEQSITGNVSFDFGGDKEREIETASFLKGAFSLTFLIMILLLLADFGSFIAVVVTMLTIELSFIGVLFFTAMMGKKFSIVMSGLAIVVLIGISVNDIILFMSTFKDMYQEKIVNIVRKKSDGDNDGEEKGDEEKGDAEIMADNDARDIGAKNDAEMGYPIFAECLMKSAIIRSKPIIITTVTTVLGILPMMFKLSINFFRADIAIGAPSAAMWVQISVAIFGGMLMVTILTLFFVPSLMLFFLKKYDFLKIKLLILAKLMFEKINNLIAK